MTINTVAVCIACFNRKEKTIRAIESLNRSSLPEEFQLQIHLFDDGSSDGTVEEVTRRFANITVYQGDGTAFWAGGMRVAYAGALRTGAEYIIWMNDDVVLFEDAVVKAIGLSRQLGSINGTENVVVGAMKSALTGQVTYSGFRQRSRLRPLLLERLDPSPSLPVECDTVNANFLLIPRGVAIKVGGIPRAYIQSLADIDLGYSARKHGFKLWIAPGYAGTCEANEQGRRAWRAAGISLSERFRRLKHPLGSPPMATFVFCLRNFPMLAPIQMSSVYFGLLWAHFKSSAIGRR